MCKRRYGDCDVAKQTFGVIGPSHHMTPIQIRWDEANWQSHHVRPQISTVLSITAFYCETSQSISVHVTWVRASAQPDWGMLFVWGVSSNKHEGSCFVFRADAKLIPWKKSGITRTLISVSVRMLFKFYLRGLLGLGGGYVHDWVF